MKAEIEAKFLNVDKENIRKLLKNIGAELVAPERLMDRAVFNGKRKAEYYRVRNEGSQITMSFKREEKRSIEGMKEICLTVDNYNNAVEFLTSLAGKLPKSHCPITYHLFGNTQTKRSLIHIWRDAFLDFLL